MDTDGANSTCTIDGTDGRVAISVLSREAADPAAEYWDANWLATTVEVRAGDLSGRLQASLRADELAGFLLELQRLIAGDASVARFRSIEGWLSLDVAVEDDLVHVTGLARRPSAADNELRFAFGGLDRPALGRVVDDLDRILEGFPVLGRRDQ
jgi:hypothetical protein